MIMLFFGNETQLLFEPPPVYFMHVPKTGGTSLGRWLRDHYGRRDYFDLSLTRLNRYTPTDLRQFRCLHSWHHGQSMFDLIGRTDLLTATMLRDPIERAVSKFHQRALLDNPRDWAEDYLQRMRPILHSELQECLEHELVIKIISNDQTKVLGGRIIRPIGRAA